MNNKNNSTGITFSGALLLIFITLKLTKLITWSWIWDYLQLRRTNKTKLDYKLIELDLLQQLKK